MERYPVYISIIEQNNRLIYFWINYFHYAVYRNEGHVRPSDE